MRANPNILFAVIWIGWLLSWIAAALWSAPAESRAATWRTGLYRSLIIAGATLLTPWAVRRLGAIPLWHNSLAVTYALAGVTLAGIILMWWARLYLGRLWSSAITRKQDHQVIETGPYALVRHPIYTGLIIAIAATAAAQATWTALVGAALVTAGLCVKAQAEERFLMAELGADAYGAYRRRVPMLLPFLKIGRR